MARIRVPVTNFEYGEVTPSLVSRTDTRVYTNGAESVKNFFLKETGSLFKRCGTTLEEKINGRFVSTTYDDVQNTRLFPFIFSDDEQYVVWLDGTFTTPRCRVIHLDASNAEPNLQVFQVQNLTADIDGNPLPWDKEFLHEIQFAQEGDYLFFTHQRFMPRALVRTSLTGFHVETFSFAESPDGYRINQPYFKFQDLAVTLNPSASTGNGITITTSANYFDITGTQSGGNYPDSKHVGVTLRYHDNEIEITSVQSATQATGNIRDELLVHLDVDALESTEGSADIQLTFPLHGLAVGESITISDAGTVGGISINQINGTRTVQEVIDENIIVFTAGANANSSDIGGGSPKIVTHAPTTEWAEQSYSELRGYPAAITFHENRLWFGGSTSQPSGLWASKSAEYFNFDTGDAEDNDAIDLTASIGEVNTIRHLVSNRDLQIFTSTSELYIPSFTEKPLTPTNAIIKRQTPFGCGYIRPIPFDGATLFVQNTGDVVREFVYSDSEGAYVATSISQLATHLIRSPWQGAVINAGLGLSGSYAFFVNKDGTMAVFSSDRAAEKAGWTEFKLTNESTSKIKSVVAIKDRLFIDAQVNMRTAGGSNIYYNCLLEFDTNKKLDVSEFHDVVDGILDFGASGNGSEFGDKSLAIIAGGSYLGNFYINFTGGGDATLDLSSYTDATEVEVGLPFDVEYKSFPIDLNVQGGPLTNEPRSINKITVDFTNTLSATVNNKVLAVKRVNDDITEDPIPVSEKKEFRLLGYSKNPQVTITQSEPLDLQINGFVAEVTI